MKRFRTLFCLLFLAAACDHAAAETAKSPAGGGLLSMISLMTKPESQQTLQFLLKFGEALRGSQAASGEG